VYLFYLSVFKVAIFTVNIADATVYFDRV